MPLPCTYAVWLVDDETSEERNGKMPDENKNGIPDLFDLSPEERKLKESTTAAQAQMRIEMAKTIARIEQESGAEYRQILLTIVNALHTAASLINIIPDGVLPEDVTKTSKGVVHVAKEFMNAINTSGLVGGPTPNP